jgi:hypothetical protein
LLSSIWAALALMWVVRNEANNELLQHREALLGEHSGLIVEKSPVPPSLDEPSGIQDLRVIRDGGLCEPKKVIKLGASGFTVFEDEFQDREPRRVTQGVENGYQLLTLERER